MEMYGMTGEPLGTIGSVLPTRLQQSETLATSTNSHEKGSNLGQPHGTPQDVDLEPWQRTFLSKPSVSIRKGYARNFERPAEPTSTVVLSARSGRFIDVRFPMVNHHSQTHQAIPLAKNPEFWAFTGNSTTTWIQSPAHMGYVEFPYSAHVVWHHDLDSHGHGSGEPDEADMFLLPNGDCMEVGFSSGSAAPTLSSASASSSGPLDVTTGPPEVNRSRGDAFMYKEYWAEPLPSKAYKAALPGTSDLAKTPCIVAETIDSPDGVEVGGASGIGKGKGLIIRVGDYIQGIYKQDTSEVLEAHEEPILVERWTRDAWPGWGGDHQDDQEDWYRDPRNNTGERNRLPCAWLMADRGQITVGDVLNGGASGSWRIVEVWRG